MLCVDQHFVIPQAHSSQWHVVHGVSTPQPSDRTLWTDQTSITGIIQPASKPTHYFACCGFSNLKKALDIAPPWQHRTAAGVLSYAGYIGVLAILVGYPFALRHPRQFEWVKVRVCRFHQH